MSIYLWVHEVGRPVDSTAHYAGEGAPPGRTLCGQAEPQGPWDGPRVEDGGPADRCGDCVLQYLAVTGQIRLVSRSQFTPIGADLPVPGAGRAR